MTQYFLFAWLAIASLGAVAQQTASFEGTITNEKRSPLQGITVLLRSQQKGAISDAKGKFYLKNIQPTADTVEVFGVGFERQKFEVVFQVGKKQTRSIILKEQIVETDEVVIVGETEGQLLEKTAQAVKVIELREAKLKSADLGEILAQTEGVSVQRGGGLGSSFRFALNGLSEDKVRIFYDGIPLEFTPYAFGIANVPVNRIDRVEVYKGVVPMQFGADALGGSVNLVAPKTNHGISGGASYQIGSFNTHRATANVSYASDSSGWFFNLGGFYDYTDNNYKVDVAIPNELGTLEPATVERFHDAYQGFGGNFIFGIKNKKWADELSVEGYYGNYENEIQNTQSPGLIDVPSLGIEEAVSGIPLGDLRFNSFSQGINVNYQLTLGTHWELDLKAGYNYNERVSIDTSRNVYNWNGEVVRQQNIPGELGVAEHLITESQSLFARQQLTYNLSEQHVFKLSVAPTYQYRTADNLLVEGRFDPALDEGFLFNLVSGLEYTAEIFDGRLQNIAFIKNYRQSIRIESLDPSVDEVLIDERSVSNYGAGNGIRYNWSECFSTKLSYEFAYRLPRQDEIFGDGQLIFENLELRPESSHNVNLQAIYRSKSTNLRDWQLEGNFFLRRIDDLIFLLVNQDDFGSFENVWSATSQGIEVSGKIRELLPRLSLSANTTYQVYFNTSDEGPFTQFRGDRIPNTPYFFANGAAEYELKDVLKRQDRLVFFYNYRYVHPFFIGWGTAGRGVIQFKLEVPAQMVHSTGITHQLKIGDLQNALTLEVQNLTNAKVFDLFGVQRPGRAFYLKTTLQF
ncbi:MAG: TonB-dependent receptor plug domain-containing protein [Bacteroidota bacterium]